MLQNCGNAEQEAVCGSLMFFDSEKIQKVRMIGQED